MISGQEVEFHTVPKVDWEGALSLQLRPLLSGIETDAVLKDKFWGVQAEIAALLGQMKNTTAMEYLIKGLSLKHPAARKAVVAALGEFKDPKIIKDIKPLLDDKNSYLVPAEVCRTLGKTKDPSVEPLIMSMLTRASWLDAIRAVAVDGIAHLKGAESIEFLKKYSEYGNEERPRFAAIRRWWRPSEKMSSPAPGRSSRPPGRRSPGRW